MLKRIFPERIDNHYRGHKLALWIFVPLTFMKVAISLGAIFNPDGGAQSADGIPLDTYTSGGAETVIALFALLGRSDLLLGLLFVVVLIRYRAMIPLMYVLIVVGNLGGKLILLMKPIVTVGASGVAIIGLVILGLSIIGLVLSLWGKGYLPRQESKSA